ncbi:MAG TPA: hypothetical protein VKT30_04965 [Caulobacteraceae bacterium]|nr:hypothetical protein [Caulobacteraceae bacterium]
MRSFRPLVRLGVLAVLAAAAETAIVACSPSGNTANIENAISSGVVASAAASLARSASPSEAGTMPALSSAGSSRPASAAASSAQSGYD